MTEKEQSFCKMAVDDVIAMCEKSINGILKTRKKIETKAIDKRIAESLKSQRFWAMVFRFKLKPMTVEEAKDSLLQVMFGGYPSCFAYGSFGIATKMLKMAEMAKSKDIKEISMTLADFDYIR